MKKWLFAAVSSVLMMNAVQAESWCGYKDFFHLSNAAHPGIYIVGAYSEPDVLIQMVGPRSFVIKDSNRCRAGYAHVTVAYDISHWCVLDIKDGPLMMSPTINASCNGMRYLDISYDGFNSYSYSINLD